MCPSHKNIGNWHELDGQNETSLLKGGHFGMMSISKNGLKKGPWTTAEDEILAEYVKKHGEGNWNSVQKNTRLLRCGKSCRLRWVNHLRPNLKKGAFTAEEGKKIVELHAKMGNKWAKMAAQLPGRTDNEIKNYWNTRTKKLHRAGLPLYPPELCTQALAENQQPDVSGGRSTADDKHDNFVQATIPSIPEIKFSGLISQECLSCFPEVSNLHCGDMMTKGPACLQYPYVAPANHPTKWLQEFPLPSDGHNFSMGNGFAHAYQTQSSYQDPLAPPCQEHNFHVSSSELKPLHFELPSVQNPETHKVLCKKSCLSTPPLEPIYEVPSQGPIGNFQFEQEANSEKNGLLCSARPVLSKNPRIATDLSSAVTSVPYGQSSSNKSRKGREVEMSEDFSNPVSPLDSSISLEYDCITPKTKRRCLTSDEDLAYKAIFGCPEAALVDQEYHEGEDDELSSWLDFSGLDPLIDLGWLCQGYCLR